MSESDQQLLERYASEKAEDAFSEIVQRHLGLVYSAALRQVGSRELAQEAAQSVFNALAQQAERISAHTVLPAWLYQVTRRTAIDIVRRETRRRRREQIASEMNALNHSSSADVWTEIQPLLDDAMAELSDSDRTVVLLRYFSNKSLREIGETMAVSDDAAQKRLSRALGRLRAFLAKRGVAATTSGLAVLLRFTRWRGRRPGWPQP